MTDRKTAGRPDDRKRDADENDKVDEALEETFPASDPPPFSPTTGPAKKDDQPDDKGS